MKETKRKLYDAVQDLLKENNPSEISVSKLAVKAGISRTTIYEHYDNMQELISEMKSFYYSQLKPFFEMALLDPSDEKKQYNVNLELYKHVYDNRKFYMIEWKIRDGIDVLHLANFIFLNKKNKIKESIKNDITSFYIPGFLNIVDNWRKEEFNIEKLKMVAKIATGYSFFTTRLTE